MSVANVNVTKILMRRGNTAQNAVYTGVNGEVTVDLQVKTLRIHDGVTQGGTVITAGGVVGAYSNTNAAAYIPTDPTITSIQANVAAANASIPNLLAISSNILPSANVTYSLGSSTRQWRDLWVSNNTIYIGNVPLTVSNGNLLVNGSLVTGSGSGTDDVLRANVGAYQTFANANAATQATSINTVNANVGAYQTFANANAATQATSINTVNANVGAYQTFANSNAATQSTAIATLQTQVYANANVNTYLSSSIIGSLSTSGNLVVGGNLIVNGNSTIINTTSYTIEDNILQIADGNPADSLDIGFVGHRTVGSVLQHTGLVRDASAGNWKLFSNVTAQPGNTIDFTNAVYDDLFVGNISANIVKNGYTWTFGTGGNLTVPASGIITAPNAQEFRLQARAADSVLRNEIELDPNNGTYMSVWSDGTTSFSSADWDTGSWNNESGLGAARFTDAQALQNFWTTGIGSLGLPIEASINGGARTPNVFYENNNGETYGVYLGLDAVPPGGQGTTVPITSLVFYYQTQSKINIDRDGGEILLDAQSMDLDLRTTNILDLRAGENLNLRGLGQYPVRIYTNNSTHMWEFDTSGSLTLPSEGKINGIGAPNNRYGYISWDGNSSGDGQGWNTMRLVPDQQGLEDLDTYIILDPAYVDGPGSIHIRAGGTRDNSLANLYLGGANSHVKIGTGVNPPVTVMANNRSWTFGNTGTTQFPDGTILAPVSQSITMQSDQYAQLMWQNANVTVAPDMAVMSNFYVAQNSATLDIVYRDGSSNQQQKSWLWSLDGGMSFPDTTTQYTAFSNAAVATYLANYDGGINFTASPAVITGLGNISSANFTFANGVNILSTVGAGSYGNTQVAQYLSNYDGGINFTSSTAAITNVDTITVLDSIRSPAYQFSNGVSIFDGITGGGGTTYTDANVVAMLAANTAVFIGNVGNIRTSPIQSNITQVFIGGNTALTSGNAATPNSTFLMYNAYFAANGAILARNTTTGAGFIEIASSGIALIGNTAAVTANAAPTFTQFLKMNSSIGAQFSGIVTAPGVTSTSTVAVNAATGITTNQATFPLVNTSATTINFGGAATTINMGSTASATGNVFVGGQIGSNAYNLTLRANGTFNIATSLNSNGGFNSPPYTNQAVIGGSGTGMTANYSSVGGYLSTLTIANVGTGYQNGDVISVPGGIAGNSFVLQNYNSGRTGTGTALYTFGIDGNLMLPGNVTIANVGSMRYANGINILSSISTLVATNFSTANAVITGGYATGLANVTLTSGGNISGVGNIVGSTANTTITAGAYTTSFLSNGVVVTSNILGTNNNLTLNGNINQTNAYFETYGNVVNTGGNITFNFANTSVFYATLSANVTANIVGLANNISTVTGFTVIVDQGATPYRIANIQFNGGATSNIRWIGTTVPTGTASNTDIISISLINLGNGTYRILGQQSSYG